MCGIAGYLVLRSFDWAVNQRFQDYFTGVVLRTGRRGPDVFGVVGADDRGNTRVIKTALPDEPAKFSPDWQDATLRQRQVTATLQQLQTELLPSVVCINFRGIPTTEAITVSGQPELSIQPYGLLDETTFITHNGLINNDEELYATYEFTPVMGQHDIDSYVLAQLYAHGRKQGMNELEAGIFTFIEAEGSFAAALLDTKDSCLLLARNFRGLHLALVSFAESNAVYLVWASEEYALTDVTVDNTTVIVTKELPLDTLLYIPYLCTALQQFGGLALLDECIEVFGVPLATPDPDAAQRAVVVISGGLDSTVCATWACQTYREVHLLHFNYGALAEEPEDKAVKAIYEYLQTQYPAIKMSLLNIPTTFFTTIGGSTLTDPSFGAIAEGEKGAETTNEWVPARNLVMISLAAAYADRHALGNIILGLNMEEGGVFEDNAIEFYRLLEQAMRIGTHAHPNLVMPLGNLMKHHIWKLGKQLNAPLQLSWSCYRGNEIRCGCCGPDFMRLRAAMMNDDIDMVEYSQLPDWYQEFVMRKVSQGE